MFKFLKSSWQYVSSCILFCACVLVWNYCNPRVVTREVIVPSAPPLVVKETNKVTYIGSTCSIKGDIAMADGNIVIDGRVDGNADTKGKLTIGKGGLLHGKKHQVGAIVIEGSADGDIDAEFVALETTSAMNGDITAKKLRMTDGAAFTGFLHINQPKEREKKNAAISKPPDIEAALAVKEPVPEKIVVTVEAQSPRNEATKPVPVVEKPVPVKAEKPVPVPAPAPAVVAPKVEPKKVEVTQPALPVAAVYIPMKKVEPVAQVQVRANKLEAETLQDLAYEAMRQDKGTDWPQFLAAYDKKVKAYLDEDTENNNVSAYLYTKLVGAAQTAQKSGDLKDVKEFFVYMALYKHYGEQPPSVVIEKLSAKKDAISRIAADFSWQKVMDFIQTNK